MVRPGKIAENVLKSKEIRNLRKPLPHQAEATAYCQSTDTPALFLEMRLGKTKVVIDWLRPPSNRKVLVVAPVTTLVTSWADEILKEGEPAPAFLLGTTKERMDAFSTRKKWNLINYEGLLRCPNLLSDYRWDAIVLDESTRARNPKAEITKLLIKNRLNANKRCILSGLPDPEGPLDFCEQFRFLHGRFMGFSNYWSFRNIAFFPIPKTHKWFPKPAFKDRVRDFVQKNSFILSRKDAGLANKKIYQVRLVEMTSPQAAMMDKLEREFAVDLPSGERKSTIWAPVKHIWMARLAGGFVEEKFWISNKADELLDLLKGELLREQVVVWFRFNSEIAFVAERLKAAQITYATVEGSTSKETRADLRLKFSQKRIRVLLLQIKIGRYGLDLSTASTAIYYSNGHSSEDRRQSEDRIEHISKKEPLLIIDLVTAESVDEDILQSLRKKEDVSDFYLRKQIQARVERRSNEKSSSNRPRHPELGVGIVAGRADADQAQRSGVLRIGPSAKRGGVRPVGSPSGQASNGDRRLRLKIGPSQGA